MRSVHYIHNLPTLVDKNITHRPILPFNFAPNSSVLFFSSIKQLILNTESIPLSLCLQSGQFLGLQIMITHNNVTLKHQSQTINLPLNVVKQKWMRINFGEEINKIEIRPQQNENKLDRSHFYAKVQIWKKEERKETTGLYSVALQGSIMTLRNNVKLKQKMDRMVDNSNKKDISRYLKMKLIERSSITATNKPKLQPLRSKQTSLHNCYGDENHKSKGSALAYQKYESATLDFNPLMENKQISAKRDSNTSNSIRSQPTVMKFSRNINRLRDPKIRLSRNKDIQSTFQNSQFLPVSNHRPRFYQQISLSHQQIELKRRKFDSQFIHKQKVDLADKSTVVQKENNESEVKQQINKMEGSKMGSHVQDTFERGIFQNSRVNSGEADQESGTLCESVFQ